MINKFLCWVCHRKYRYYSWAMGPCGTEFYLEYCIHPGCVNKMINTDPFTIKIEGVPNEIWTRENKASAIRLADAIARRHKEAFTKNVIVTLTETGWEEYRVNGMWL